MDIDIETKVNIIKDFMNNKNTRLNIATYYKIYNDPCMMTSIQHEIEYISKYTYEISKDDMFTIVRDYRIHNITDSIINIIRDEIKTLVQIEIQKNNICNI